MVNTYSKSMDQPGKVANPARGQLNRENKGLDILLEHRIGSFTLVAFVARSPQGVKEANPFSEMSAASEEQHTKAQITKAQSTKAQ